jgi:hypothetical protein
VLLSVCIVENEGIRENVHSLPHIRIHLGMWHLVGPQIVHRPDDLSARAFVPPQAIDEHAALQPTPRVPAILIQKGNPVQVK